MNERVYIKDFCEDLNYQGVILYIGNVSHSKLLGALLYFSSRDLQPLL